MLVQGSVEVLPLLFALVGIKALLRGLVLVGYGVSIHDTHVMNAVHTLNPKILDQQVLRIPPLLRQ